LIWGSDCEDYFAQFNTLTNAKWFAEERCVPPVTWYQTEAGREEIRIATKSAKEFIEKNWRQLRASEISTDKYIHGTSVDIWSIAITELLDERLGLGKVEEKDISEVLDGEPEPQETPRHDNRCKHCWRYASSVQPHTCHKKA